MLSMCSNSNLSSSHRDNISCNCFSIDLSKASGEAGCFDIDCGVEPLYDSFLWIKIAKKVTISCHRHSRR